MAGRIALRCARPPVSRMQGRIVRNGRRHGGWLVPSPAASPSQSKRVLDNNIVVRGANVSPQRQPAAQPKKKKARSRVQRARSSLVPGSPSLTRCMHAWSQYMVVYSRVVHYMERLVVVGRPTPPPLDGIILFKCKTTAVCAQTMFLTRSTVKGRIKD